MSSTKPSVRPFSSKYQRLRLLGKGGYGSVWLARRRSDGVFVAAKIIRDSKCRRKSFCPSRLAEIPDEILLSESLNHPNIISLHEALFQQKKWLLVMEYSPDYVDLHKHLKLTGPLSVNDAREVLVQLLETCSYLISRNIDHRDLKASNILYNPQTRQIKLLDFGCAGFIPHGPYTQFQGTKIFTPPEFFKTGQYSALPALTWSIGCLAYVLLNARYPFNTTGEIKDYSKLRFKNPGLSKHSKDFLSFILTGEENYRPTLGQILFHPYMD